VPRANRYGRRGSATSFSFVLVAQVEHLRAFRLARHTTTNFAPHWQASRLHQVRSGQRYTLPRRLGTEDPFPTGFWTTCGHPLGPSITIRPALPRTPKRRTRHERACLICSERAVVNACRLAPDSSRRWWQVDVDSSLFVRFRFDATLPYRSPGRQRRINQCQSPPPPITRCGC